ncbi:MAG TPA: hypothetical protein VJ843_05455 [Candidatus Saccharimonadales bacterium]|nr:hypothetical protein [Candidatus Saccharimonadales bacterium]
MSPIEDEPTDWRGLLLVGFICMVGGIVAGFMWLDHFPHALGWMGFGALVLLVLGIGPSVVFRVNPPKYFLAVFAGFGFGLVVDIIVTVQR